MASKHEQTQNDTGAADRNARVQAVLDERLRRRGAVDEVSDVSLIAAHPGLMPELGEELRKLRIIAAAREQAFAPPSPNHGQTIEHKPSTKRHHKDSRGLHIRCPHCSNFVEVITDTPYEEICCSACGSNFSLVERDEATRMAAPLKSIGRFDLVTRLGLGGFGTVWKAHDRELDRTVAVKIPRRGQLSAEEIDHFFREARAAAQLRHSNIVPVHEVGREGETLFIVSDLVRGVTLSDWLTGNPLSPREIAALCVPIADALHHAHEHGVVHRDLKPSNILIDEIGQPHLTDFGLAKREVGEITMTVDGQILGTPGYMSPEQAGGQGHWTDRRTDIYSFGVILFQLLTGELPFRGNAQMQIHQRLSDDAPDPRTLNGYIPRDLATICLKCLEREPGRRYATAAAVGEELNCFLEGVPIKARPISKPARLVRWARRKPWVASTALLVTLLAAIGPIVAVLIEGQRTELKARYQERNRLIESTKQDVDRAKSTIQKLEEQLDIWNGRAIPSAFWLPKRDTPPRQILLRDLFDRRHNTLAAQLSSGSITGASKVRGYMALGMMAESVKKSSLAREYYQHARDAITSLPKQSPEQTPLTKALAQCESRLSDLNASDDRVQAAEDSERARKIYERLAIRDNADAVSHIDWLEAEINSAMQTIYDPGEEHILRVNEISRALSNKWPTDPDGIYDAACYLRHEEPLWKSANPPSGLPGGASGR
jgi:hypothetical protein